MIFILWKNALQKPQLDSVPIHEHSTRIIQVIIEVMPFEMASLYYVQYCLLACTSPSLFLLLIVIFVKDQFFVWLILLVELKFTSIQSNTVLRSNSHQRFQLKLKSNLNGDASI